MTHFMVRLFAAATCPAGSIEAGHACNDTGLPVVNAGPDQLHQLLSIAFGVIGAVAVLFLVIGGLRLVMSEGDPQDTAKARNTIIYSVIGLAVAITAEAIVTLVLNRL